MQAQNVESPSKTPHQALPDFRHVRNSLSYADMHPIRQELLESLQLKNIPEAHINNLLLILTEILSNLVKHPAQKVSHVEIHAHISGTLAHMEVLDNSSPFANFDAKCKEGLSHLHAGETEAEGGYGLGCILKLSKTAAYSTKNGLNCFKISYSLPEKNGAETAPQQKKVFLIDDDPISIQIHGRMLDSVYQVISFETAEEALAAFPQHKPDLVVSDLTMPGMDGIALRHALNGVPGGNTTPFIFLSGYTDNEHNPYISQLGVDDFLCKPVTREKLHAVLSRLLHRSEQLCASLQGQFHHDITQLLKPSLPPSYGGWKFLTRHLIAEAGGGDFILHQQTPTNQMTVLIDVMGHGRQAKFFSYAYAGYLRSMFRLYGGTLDTTNFLKFLSESISGDELLESTPMTCQSFQFFQEGILKISSAGHPCPVFIRGARAEMIDVKGPLPGLVSDVPYDMKSLRLERGDKVLFMTDGFLEVFDRRGHAAQKLLRRIEAVHHTSAEELTDRLWQEFQKMRLTQNISPDDATIIIAEYGGSI